MPRSLHADPIGQGLERRRTRQRATCRPGKSVALSTNQGASRPPDGTRRFRTATFDQRRQVEVPVTRETAADDAIMLVDGAFLYRPELHDGWDFRIFVDFDFDLVLERGSRRNQAWMESLAAAEHRYRTRYIPGEKISVEGCAG